MTPQLEAAIAAIQPLSVSERQQLLQILIQNNSAPTVDLKTVHNIKELAADFWPEEDSIEDFLDFLRQQRQEIT